MDRRSVLRAIDANLNRAREALRVLEDLARFGRERERLFRRAKALRHGLADLEAAFGLRAGDLADARDPEGDVGRCDPAAPYAGPGPLASANARRLEEALRVLEEFGRLLGRGAEAASAARFEAYALEKDLVPGLDARLRIEAARLCFVLDPGRCAGDPAAAARAALRGGADALLVRNPRATDRGFVALAASLRPAAEEAGALLLVDGRADVAAASGAHGVHLGREGISVAEARGIVGWNLLVGLSARSREEIDACAGADYVGIGNVFTASGRPALGVEAAAALFAASPVPAFASGGIHPGNAGELAKAGIRRAAVSSAVALAPDPETAARDLRAALDPAAPDRGPVTPPAG